MLDGMGACLCPPGDLEFVTDLLGNRKWGPVVNPVVIPWRKWSREASPPPDVFKTGWLLGVEALAQYLSLCLMKKRMGEIGLWNTRGWHQEIKWLLCAYIFQKIFCLYFQFRNVLLQTLISFQTGEKKKSDNFFFFFFCHYPFWEKRFGLTCCQLVFQYFFSFSFVFFLPVAHIAVICTLGTRWSELSICPYWTNPLGCDVWPSGSSESLWYPLSSPTGWDVVRSCAVLHGARAEYSLLFRLQEGRTLHCSAGTAPLGLAPHRLGMGEREYVSLPIHLQFHLLCLWSARYTQPIVGQERKNLRPFFFLCSKERKPRFY